MDAYVPARGDVIWVDFSQTMGQEQRGRRPFLVLSPQRYNQMIGLAVGCPITSKVKGYRFEVAIPPDLPFRGVILSDQVKSFSWTTRNAEFIGRMPDQITRKVTMVLRALLED